MGGCIQSCTSGTKTRQEKNTKVNIYKLVTNLITHVSYFETISKNMTLKTRYKIASFNTKLIRISIRKHQSKFLKIFSEILV